MFGPREVLNDLRWHWHALDQASVTYVHRGAPHDVRSVSGASIRTVGRSFFAWGDERHATWIPYHRVVRIEAGGRVVWTRAPR